MPRKEPRDYQKENREYHSKPRVKKDRATRNAARRKMAKAGKVHKGDGKEVDHIKGARRGNADSNLRVVSRLTNRRKG